MILYGGIDDMEMDEEFEYADRPNKTAIKREMLALRDMGKQMMALPSEQIESFPVSETLKQEIIKAKSFRKGALRRQIIYIEKLMRDEDGEQIERHLEEIKRPHKESTKQFHQLETWRDKLVAGDNDLMEELIAQHETLDRQHIRQLVRNAQKEATLNKPPKSSRALFRYLKDSVE